MMANLSFIRILMIDKALIFLIIEQLQAQQTSGSLEIIYNLQATGNIY